MIDVKALTDADIGRWVKYTKISTEVGRIKRIGKTFIFVVYKCDGNWQDYQDYTAAATNPEDLDFLIDIKCEDCPKRKAGECEFAIDGGSCTAESFL